MDSVTVGQKVNSNNQQHVTAIARGGGIAFIGRLFSLALSYLLAVVLARGLGKADYGLFVVGFSLVTLVGSFALLGLNRGTVRFVALYLGSADYRRAKGVFLSAVGIVILSGLSSAALVITFAPILSRLLKTPPEFIVYLWSIAGWLLIWALIYELTSVVEAVRHLEYRTLLVDIGWPLLRLVLSVGAFLLGGGLVAVTGANILASLLVLIVMGVVVYRIFWRKFDRVTPLFSTHKLLAFSVPVMLFNLLNLSQSQAEIYLLTAFQSSEVAGIFNAAARTSILIVAFLDGLGLIFSPFVADLTHKRQFEALGSLMTTVTRWSLMIGLPAALLLMLFSKTILGIFGAGFEAASPTLIVLAAAQLINATTGPVGIVLTMSGHPNLNLFNSVLTLSLSVLLGFFLIPRLGILGAAISSGLSTSLVNLLRTAQVYRILGIWAYDRQFFKPILAGLLAGLLTYLLSLSTTALAEWLCFVVGSAAFLAIYIFMILWLGLSQSDHMVINLMQGWLLKGIRRTS